MKVFLLQGFLLLFSTVSAQLKADFTMDKSGGCSPFSVFFTNTTTGASASATYEWSFGNGNSSVLKNAGAVYQEEKTYTVTLTVRDGALTSSKSNTVTVFKKPTVAFSFTPDNGCIPLSVSFTSSSQPGDGNLTMYHWDFGDGITMQTTNASITHEYTIQKTATVGLTAINSHGCSQSVTKSNVIRINPALQAAFSANKTTICDVPGTVEFSNTSTGSGTLTYEWDFGDGQTSKEKTPVHRYQTKGVYGVKLTVKSSDGCTNTMSKPGYINAGNFNSEIQAPSLVCEGTNVVFTNSSSSIPNQTRWLVDGVDAYTWSGSLNYTFLTPGTHKVEMINSFNGCDQKVEKSVDVKAVPALTGFIAEVKDPCGAPARVEFRDTSRDAVSWQWNFNYYGGNAAYSTAKTANHTFPTDNWYYVQLTTKNAAGCATNVLQRIDIFRPQVGIFLAGGSRSEGCGQLTVKLETRTTEEIVSYAWNFGDGGVSSEPMPTHTYTRQGSYPVLLTYKTKNGCTGTTQLYGNIQVWDKPVANFTVQPEVCGNSPVLFTNTSRGYVINYTWDFGDNGYSGYNSPVYQYQAEGTYTVRLIANNWICNDTMIKQAIIKVSPPFAKIERFDNSCDGTRGEVNLIDGSRQATSWAWDFGDGTTSSYTSPQPGVKHTYARTGSYKVVQTVKNGSCTVKDSITVYVLLKQKPVFGISKSEVCLEESLTYNVTGLEENPHPVSIYNNDYQFTKWQYKDGTDFSGYYYYNSNWSPNTSGTVNFTQPKDGELRAIIQAPGFSCYDTSNFVALKINGVNPAFEVVSDNSCFKTPIVLKDKSKTTGSLAIKTWEWNFGDGTIKTFSQGGEVSHRYNQPGGYYVTLKVTDEKGCASATPSYTGFVRAPGPKAAFVVNGGNSVQLNSSVSFYNMTNTSFADNVSYKWDFGNGTVSSTYSPSCTYTEPGKYDVVLIAENRTTGCSDTTKQTITVKVFNTAFTFTTAFIGNYGTCPPVRANFTNTSTNYTKLVWDFGDGFILEDQPSPSHVYEKAGKYAVTLTVHGYNGLSGVYEDTVIVLGPTATIKASDLDGCIGTEIKLNAPEHTDTESYVWDFGDGFVTNAIDSFATHIYESAGSYTPSLILKDDKGCSSLISLTDAVTIYPDPAIVITPALPVVCKTIGVRLEASGAASYQWSPELGLSNTSGASVTALPAKTSTFQITGTDQHGCIGSVSTTVEVAEPFAIKLSPAAEICSGNSTTLHAAGAATYQWIDVTTGLSNTTIASPIASPQATTTYTVAGYDRYQCYSDTASVQVIVRPSPAVNAGADQQVIYGTSTALAATYSNDVIKWTWSPAEFLSCINCPAPVVKPYRSMEYVLEVLNQFNCPARDTVQIKAGCGEEHIFIPTAFTPNADGLNDRFTIHGTGVSIIRSLRVYNRWGELIYENRNFFPGDFASSWDGRFMGREAPAAAYVYFAELECGAGEIFSRKGTITLIR